MASLTIHTTQQPPALNSVREQVGAEAGGGVIDMIRRIAPLALGIIAGVAAAFAIGAIPGLIIGGGIGLISWIATQCLWDSNSHEHTQERHPIPDFSVRNVQHVHSGSVREQVSSGRNSSNFLPPSGRGHHVPVGGGHTPPLSHSASVSSSSLPPPSGLNRHVPVGGGHAPHTPHAGTAGTPSFHHPSGAGGHVPVGGGHTPNIPFSAFVGPPPFNIPSGHNGHAGVGYGYTPPMAYGGVGGNPPFPPPAGANGHVGVGSRNRNW